MSKIDSFSDEEFKRIVSTSASMWEAFVKMGYTKNHGHPTTTAQFKSRCDKLGISPPVFTNDAKRKDLSKEEEEKFREIISSNTIKYHAYQAICNEIEKMSYERFENLIKRNNINTEHFIKFQNSFSRFSNYDVPMYKKCSASQIKEAVISSSSIKEIAQKIGYKRVKGEMIKGLREYLQKEYGDFIKSLPDFPMANCSRIYHLTNEEFISLLNNCSSMREAEHELGYTGSGYNGIAILRRCASLNFYPDFLTERDKERMNNLSTQKKISYKITDEEIFCEKSQVSQSTLRKRVKKLNLFPYKCAICGLPPLWNDKELTLTLDHINGVNNDNRTENLRWVCPNCDRQLSTFGSRNTRRSKD